MKKEFILNGTRITSLRRFYDEVEKELLVDRNVIDNWSLDVLDDVLDGGYGLHNLEAEIIVRWTNYRRSKKKMNAETLESIVKTFQSHENITFTIE